ncbi:MAG: SGNH/GDSL hydrolase family protein [Myxococcales bacterium]|nr:SGNH/GDSL hydrolase family protein [Myxococcales bacterium]
MDTARYQRYVAIGDSSTEGLEDPDGRGGFRGWADRLAEHLDAAYPGVAYANLAVRGLSAAEIAASQLGPALAMRPDLASVVAGMNDLLRRSFDARVVAGQVAAMITALRALGATVVTFTIPDVSGRMRIGRRLSTRTAELNTELRRISSATGARLLDLASYELAYDPRMWARDRIHGNAAGHERIGAALAHLLDLPGAPADALTSPLPPRIRRPGEELAADLSWTLRYVVPWAVRRLRNRTTGHGRVAKRPTLAPVRGS